MQILTSKFLKQLNVFWELKISKHRLDEIVAVQLAGSLDPSLTLTSLPHITPSAPSFLSGIELLTFDRLFCIQCRSLLG